MAEHVVTPADDALDCAPPLNRLRESSGLGRWAARIACWALVLQFQLATVAATLLGRLRRPRKRARGIRIVLTGKFVSDGWLEAHVRPLALSSRCERIWVVTDRPMIHLPRTTYVVAPSWLQRFVGRVPSRALYCLFTALRHRPEVVGGFHLLLNGIVALIAARMVGGRSIYFCVGGWTETWGGGARSENRWFSRIGEDDPRLERRVLWFAEHCDLILTMGSRARKYFRDRGITTTVEIMSGGIDPEKFVSPNGDQPRAYDVIFVGRLVAIKRPDVLLNVVAVLVRQDPNIRVAIVGDGPLRTELEQQARQCGISPNVDFLGHRRDVASCLRRAKVVTLTSDSEGLPLSIMEAMMVGLPAVVSDVGDLGDLVDDGVNGFRPQRRDVEGFALRIAELLTAEDAYRSFSAQAKQSAAAHTLDETRRRWDKLLEAW